MGKEGNPAAGGPAWVPGRPWREVPAHEQCGLLCGHSVPR